VLAYGISDRTSCSENHQSSLNNEVFGRNLSTVTNVDFLRFTGVVAWGQAVKNEVLDLVSYTEEESYRTDRSDMAAE